MRAVNLGTPIGEDGFRDWVLNALREIERASNDTDQVLDEQIGELAAGDHVHAASAITNVPAGTIDSDNVQGAIDELRLASNIANAPAGGVAATTVQAAINELDGDKAPVSHSHVTADFANDSVTNLKLANMAANTIKGTIAGGDPADLTGTQVTTLFDVFTSLLKGLVPASGGGTTNFLRSDVTWAAPPAGAVRQVLQTTYATNANLTVQIPRDDTPPQSGEGTEILSRAITLAAAANEVLCLVSLNGSQSAAPNTWIAALFRGTTPIAAVPISSFAANRHEQPNIMFLDTPGSVGPHTYSVRVGPVGAVTLRMNGTSGVRVFGGSVGAGAATCTLTVMEIDP